MDNNGRVSGEKMGQRTERRSVTSFNQKLCGADWVNSKASEKEMFTGSAGTTTTTGFKSTATCTRRLEGRAKLVSTPRGERTEWFGRGRLRCCRGSSRRLESRSIIEVRIEMFGSFSHQLKIRITILKFAFAFSYSASGQRHEYLYTM